MVATGERACVPSGATVTRLTARAGRRSVQVGPVEDRLDQHGPQRHLGHPAEPGDGLTVHVPGHDGPDVVAGHQLDQGRLVVHVIVPAAHREVLEYQRRPGRGGEIAVEPVQPGRAAVARLQQRLGRVESGHVDAARVERVRRGAEPRRVELLGRGIPPHVVVARHVPDPAAQRGGDGLLVPVVLARQPGVRDVAAVQHEVGREPGYGRVHQAQPLDGRRGQPGVRVGDHGEPQAHASRYAQLCG